MPQLPPTAIRVLNVSDTGEEVAMMLFGETDATWMAVAMSAIAMLGGGITLLVNATKDRRMKRDALEFGAELTELKSSNAELKNGRDECMKQHAVKDVKIGNLEQRLDDCHRDHEASNRDREKLWDAVRAIQAGPV